ncbi:MAG TPA: hypothetical protein VK249_00845 [Anaerolineales bacterium]|nr:hypothetical protein [Anaerolineales bacterium]
MKATRSFPRGCFVGIVTIVLAAGLMLSTASVSHQSDGFSCYGQLGAGLPVSFLCDYSGGGSPLSSAGRIDSADFPYFSLQGTVVDLLCYALVLWITWLGVLALGRQMRNYREARS